MKKYYIPTTSMNFNCILSSESISPFGFYKKRGFGYSRWFTIPENNQEGVILLYENPFTFKRPESDQEDHPMWIEINTDEKFQAVAKGVYFCDHTIYLNSLKDSIILFSEADKNTVLSLSDSSLETKMVDLFKSRDGGIRVENFKDEAPEIRDIKKTPLDNRKIEEDQQINKIKGLLYGYYIGALLSADSKDVEKLNALRRIQDIFSAVVSSENCRPTQKQRDCLSELYTNLEKNDSETLIHILIDEANVDKKINCFHEHRNKVCDLSCVKEVWKKINQGGASNVVEVNLLLCRIKSELEKVVKDIKDKQKPLSVDKPEINVVEASWVNLNRADLNTNEKKIFLEWVKDVLSLQKYNGKISTIKESLSDALTVKAKEVLGEKWQDNPIRTYLNDLRRHIKGANFDHNWKDGLLSSIAAVIIKGDDWNKLLDFMQSKSMSDYRLAFAFYGELNGFANLTRDFTDILFDLDNREEVYKEFFGELHGVTILSNESVANPEVSSSMNESKQDSSITSDEENASAFKKILEWFNNDFKYGTKNGVSKDTLRNGLSLAMKELNPKPVLKELLDLLKNKYNKYGWKESNKPWKDLHIFIIKECNPKLFDFDNQDKQTFLKKETTKGEKEGIQMVSDPEFIRKFDGFLKQQKGINDRIVKYFVEQTEWFYSEYQNPAGLYKVNKRDNKSMIIHFKNFLKKKASYEKYEIKDDFWNALNSYLIGQYK